MASKWMRDKEMIFNKFKEQKKQEQEKQTAGPRRSEIVWKTPDKGTVDKPKIYQGRLLVDLNDTFYHSYYYHMFQDKSGKWMFVFCPKSWDMNSYCPFCAATMRLYRGSAQDKKLGYKYKRKSKHCVNFYIVKDPRDAEAESDEEKNEGKVLIYEFPDKIESKIKQEMNDDEYGNGINIFDPGEDGVDFILKVGATKPIQEEGPNHGKVFPDYSDSKFAPKPTPLKKTDKEIEEIMGKRHDLTEYLKSMERSEEDILDLVKSEDLWDMIEQDYEKQTRSSFAKSSEDMDSFPGSEQKEQQSEDTKEEKKEESVNGSEEESDLLAELENM